MECANHYTTHNYEIIITLFRLAYCHGSVFLFGNERKKILRCENAKCRWDKPNIASVEREVAFENVWPFDYVFMWRIREVSPLLELLHLKHQMFHHVELNFNQFIIIATREFFPQNCKRRTFLMTQMIKSSLDRLRIFFHSSVESHTSMATTNMLRFFICPCITKVEFESIAIDFVSLFLQWHIDFKTSNIS